MTLKLCIDCKWIRNQYGAIPRCGHTIALVRNLPASSCLIQRNDQLGGKCGGDGLLWEERSREVTLWGRFKLSVGDAFIRRE